MREIEEFKKKRFNLYKYIFDISKDKFIKFEEYSILLYNKLYSKYRIEKDKNDDDIFLFNRIYKKYKYNKEKFEYLKLIDNLKKSLDYQKRIYDDIDNIDIELYFYHLERYNEKYKNDNYLNFDDYR